MFRLLRLLNKVGKQSTLLAYIIYVGYKRLIVWAFEDEEKRGEIGFVQVLVG